jgi:hypothetical protein
LFALETGAKTDLVSTAVKVRLSDPNGLNQMRIINKVAVDRVLILSLGAPKV